MTAPPFKIRYTDTAERILNGLADPAKMKKVRKAIRLLSEAGPRHPGLHTHKMWTLRGPNGEDLWNSYVENQTPSAWRIMWVYGGPDEILIVSIGPHS